VTVRRVGLLGGTFDPPHRGHLALAQAALRSGAVDEVVFMVAGDPYQKRGSVEASATDRLAMTRALVQGTASMSVSDAEVLHDGPSYTYDTVSALLASGCASVALILGADLCAGIDRWYRANDLAACVDLLVASRPGSTIALSPMWRFTVLAMDDDSCASRDLRAELHRGVLPTDCLPEAVILEISTRSLYDGRNGTE
jgi:nicotinate-nucleotide adenylyltransferase